MTQRIYDPHVHFFAYSKGNYFWLKQDGEPFWPQKTLIRKDFNRADLKLGPDFILEGVVHIEAGFDNRDPVRETQWLQSQGFKDSAISYVAIDLPHQHFAKALDKADSAILRGIRDITEGDDAERLLDSNVDDNLALLSAKGLIWEAQFDVSDERLCNGVVDYAHNHPNLIIVINHAGLPTRANWLQWQKNIALLAANRNVFIKCSGWEILQPDAGMAWKKQVISFAISVFSSKRVMLASNFPLCLFASSYAELWQDYAQLNLPDFDNLAFANAARLYAIHP
ncbi:amidohydrolase family protein [Pseudoalteromonas sp. SSDWG2]|uniref:amidohydrolase family protein n=1 Tax=Pseudoalteromonas sp. SSDWG2 TaxID=3139391 RepID=UPI003BA8ABF7